jgi:hypothetical protein
VVEQLSDASDFNNLLDFLLVMLCNDTLPDLDINLDIKRRARRLMSKVAGKAPAIPGSLALGGVTMPADIDGGGSVVKGERHGTPVTLMVLCYKSVVSFSSIFWCCMFDFRLNRISVEKR